MRELNAAAERRRENSSGGDEEWERLTAEPWRERDEECVFVCVCDRETGRERESWGGDRVAKGMWGFGRR
jgi:hypothetical protein